MDFIRLLPLRTTANNKLPIFSSFKTPNSIPIRCRVPEITDIGDFWETRYFTNERILDSA